MHVGINQFVYYSWQVIELLSDSVANSFLFIKVGNTDFWAGMNTTMLKVLQVYAKSDWHILMICDVLTTIFKALVFNNKKGCLEGNYDDYENKVVVIKTQPIFEHISRNWKNLASLLKIDMLRFLTSFPNVRKMYPIQQ